MTVWTNGKAIRRYTGQDKSGYYNPEKRKGEWFKAIALIQPIEEENENELNDKKRQ